MNCVGGSTPKREGCGYEYRIRPCRKNLLCRRVPRVRLRASGGFLLLPSEVGEAEGSKILGEKESGVGRLRPRNLYRQTEGNPVIALAIAAFAATGFLIVWAVLKSASLRDDEEQRQRKAEQLIKGGSIFK